MASAQQTINALKAQLDTLTSQVAALNATITTQAATIAARDATITQLKATIAARDAEIVALKARIAVLEGTVVTPPPPPPPPPPTTTGWPDATNTGATGTLTAYAGPYTITVDGTIIENKTLTQSLDVKAKNVTVRNCRVTAGDTWFPIGCAPGADGLTVERCTIAGNGNVQGSYCIDTSDTLKSTITGCNLSGCENGIAPGSNCTIRGNFIHDLKAGGADPHYDGIQLGGHPNVQRNVLIEDNTIIGRDNADVWITNDFGSIDGVVVNHNQLLGKAVAGAVNGSLPVFTFYVDARKVGTIKNVTCSNNIIQRGYYGYTAVDATTVTFVNNVDPAGNPIPVPVTSSTGSTV